MTTHHDPATLVRRLQECFNAREFDRADDLAAPDFFSHALGATGFEAGKNAWRGVVAQFPDMRVVAEDILVDGDRVAVRSRIDGIPDAQPMLIEIFRVENGRLAESWEAGRGLPFSAESIGSARDPG